MERIIKTVKIKKKRESFPDTGYCSLEREKIDSNEFTNTIAEDSFHDFSSYQRENALPQYTIDDLKQKEIAERRKNFAITRSKSFAHPVSLRPTQNILNVKISSLSRKSSFSRSRSRDDNFQERMCQIVPTSNNLNFSSSSREELQSNSGWNCKEALYKVELICVCNYNFLNFQS